MSNCFTFSAREDYVEELQKFVNVSVFGSCSGIQFANPIDVGWKETYKKMSESTLFKWILKRLITALVYLTGPAILRDFSMDSYPYLT